MPAKKSYLAPETLQRFAQLWPVCQNPQEVAERTGIATRDMRNILRYRRQAEEAYGITLPPHKDPSKAPRYLPQTHSYRVHDSPVTLLIFSDAHFWPGVPCPAWQVALRIAHEHQPDYVIDNGDSMDGATVGRHPPTMWEDRPTLREELDEVRMRLAEMKSVTPRAKHLRTVGNHDTRLEAILAQRVPEFRKMPSTTVSEMVPDWEHHTSHIFNNHLLIKHRILGGDNAALRNTQRAGISTITSHTHVMAIRALTDFRGLRYGCETGTIAYKYGPQFQYAEDNPRNWQEGFLFVTVFPDKILPEQVIVGDDGAAFFRGKWYR